MKTETQTIFEKSRPGKKAYSLPECDVPKTPLSELIPGNFLRDTPPELPEVSEVDAVRHFTELSKWNYGVDSGFYPLGSCTMKYNPKINEEIVRMKGFTQIHPYQSGNRFRDVLKSCIKREKCLRK